MNSFSYQYPVRQHFGKGCAGSAIKEEMKKVGTRVMLAYGGSSLKRTGLYNKVCAWLEECGKEVIDFGGIMPNPTYAKVQEGAKMARMAEKVWGVKSSECIDADAEKAMATKGIDALESFIKEIGMPTRWSEMGITDESVLRAAADTCFLTPGCCKQFSRDEIFEILKEVM